MIKQMMLQQSFISHFFLDVKLGRKGQWKVVISYFIALFFCITNAVKCRESYTGSPDWI